MSAPKLSFCIPTYRRAAFLDRVLGYFRDAWRFPFPIEIVVVDNCSLDDTPKVVERYRSAGLPIRYFRQPRNVGVFDNLAAALRRGAGEFLVYLADDDLLIPDALQRVVAFLDAHPTVCAAYTPWESWDDVAKVSQGQFYKLDSDVIFQSNDIERLFNCIIESHVFPEIAVYRATAIQPALVPRTFCYPFFAYLSHLFDHGDVAFLRDVFYRSVGASDLRRVQERVGDVQVASDWDRYRGGLEYLLYVGLARARRSISPGKGHVVRDQIDAFVFVRMKIAMRVWAMRKDFVRAYELYVRLRLWLPANDPDLANMRSGLEVLGENGLWRGSLRMLAALQSLAEIANGAAEIDRIVWIGDLTPHISSCLRELGLERWIAVVAFDGAPAPEAWANASLVYVAANRSFTAEALAALGFQPGLTVREGALSAGIVLFDPPDPGRRRSGP
ncbi:MAG: glycosyltransferase family 2 protein [Roseiarcus sp.]